MRKGKLILTMMIAIALIIIMAISLIGCELFGGSSNKTPSNTGDDPIEDDPVDPGTGGGSGGNGGKTPSRPKPIDPGTGDTGNDSGNTGDSSGQAVRVIDQYLCIATLLGGTKTTQEDGDYRILNMYADIVKRSPGETETTKKRFVFRTNINVNGGNDNQYVLKLIDMSGVEPETPETPESGGEGGESGEGGEGSGGEDPDPAALTLENEEGSLTTGASITVGDIATEQEFEEKGTLIWAFYIINGKMYMEGSDPDQPVLYFEDFDMDYVTAIADKFLAALSDGKYDGKLEGDLFKMVDDLLGGVITINAILGLLKSFIFPTSAVVRSTTDDFGNVTSNYELTIGINSFIDQIGGLVGTIFSLGLFTLPFDLQLTPLMTFLKDITPLMVVKIVGTTYRAKGSTKEITTSFGLEVKDNNPDSETYNDYLLDLDMVKATIYSETPVDLKIPTKVLNATKYEPFSLTNIALSLDLFVDTAGTLDVGSVINSAMGKRTLPENTILVDAATGFRIQLALDADLNYGKEVYMGEDGKEHLVDNNYLVLELFLIDKYGELVDTEALIAAYYMEGSLYVNIGHLLERYYSGANIKLNLKGLPEIIQYVIDLVSGALDKVFIETLKWNDWVTWSDLWNSKYGSTESTGSGSEPSTASESSSEMSIDTGIDVVALCTNKETGKHEISTNLLTFLKAVGAVVGLGDIFSTNDEKTALKITVNTILFNGIKALASDLDINLPDGLIAELAINIDEDDGSITSIDVTAGLDARVGFKDKIGSDGTWFIGTKVLYDPIVFTDTGAKCYEDKALTKEYTFTDDDPISGHSIVYVFEDKLYADKDHTKEVVIGYNAQDVAGVYAVDAINTGIKTSDLNTTWTVSAYIYKDEWVVGYGLDEGKYIVPETRIPSTGLSAFISIHDILLCYDSSHLKRFDPDIVLNEVTGERGLSYIGWVGNVKNIKGYILSKTHSRERVTLTSSSVGTYYIYNNIDKTYTEVEVGNGEGQTPASELLDKEIYQLVENKYMDSVSKWINSLLEGTFFSLNLVIEFSKGSYNLAPLISLFLPEMKDKQLLWEFTGDFTLDASLNIGVSLNKADPTKSTVVLELVANKDIIIADSVPGANDGKLLFAKGNTILGVYGVGTKVYAELSNVKLLNITLPNLSMNLDYTTLLYTLIGEKEIFDLTFDLYELITKKDDETSNEASTSNEVSTSSESASINPSNLAEQFDGDISQALGLFINSDVVAVALTIEGLQALLNAINPDLLKGMDLTEIFDLSVSLVLNRLSGVYLDIKGSLLPKWDEENECNYFEDKEEDKLYISLRLATDEEMGYVRAVNLREFELGVDYYTYNETTGEYDAVTDPYDATEKYYTYGVSRVATPVQIGDVEELLTKYETKFEELANSTSQYYDDLIQALLKVIGDISLTITIDAHVLNSIWDINKIIDTIVADRADSFALPINVLFDEWTTEVQLCVQWYLDLQNFKNTQILIEIRYEGNVWIGLYVYNNSIIIDLNGLGLFDVEISNLQVVSSLGSVIQSLMSSIGDFSLTSLIGGLIDDAMNKDKDASTSSETSTESEASTTEGDTSTANGDASTTEGDPSSAEETKASNDLISMILASVSLQNTKVAAHLTADVFESIFRELLGFSMYLEFDISAEVDIQEGRLALGVGVERSVFADITLQLAAGERGAYRFEKDLDEIPDWNALTGEYFIKSILKNLELGLYIDINQYTSTAGETKYTRIYIEKLHASVTLDGANGGKASKDSILVTLASIDLAEFNNAGTGTKDPILYAELNYNTGKLILYIVWDQIPIKVNLGIIPIDVTGILRDNLSKIEIDLDLVSMLSGTLDGLLEQINGLVSGMVTATDNTSNAIITGVTNTPTQQEEEEEEQEEELTYDKISATQVVSSYEWGRTDDDRIKQAKNAGKYYYYNTANQKAETTTDTFAETPSGTFYYIKDNGEEQAMSVVTTYQYGTPKDLPEASSSNTNIVYRFTTSHLEYDYDEDGNVTAEHTVYEYTYYVSRQLDSDDLWARRTYKYYQLEVVSGISGMFSNIDIIGLFDMLTLYLSCDKTTKVGILNADISVNAYNFNYLIDHLLYYIFGPETILNLSYMESDQFTFSENYLGNVHWNRQDADTFFEELWSQIPGILSDVVKGFINMDLSGIISGALGNDLKNTLKGILTRLVPFAVANETHLGLNLVRGQLTNIYLTNEDKNEPIYATDGTQYKFNNGSTTLTYSNSRSTSYFTNLYIFNTSPSVGDEQYTGYDGAITWDNTPSTITYNPYMFASASAAATEYYDTYFSGTHTATFQQGTTLQKANLTFTFDGGTYSGQTVTQARLATLLGTAGTYKIKATAAFAAGTRVLTIKLVAQSSNKVVSIDRQELFVYQDFPAYIFINIAGEESARRVDTSLLQFASTDRQGNIKYKPVEITSSQFASGTYYIYNSTTSAYEPAASYSSTAQYYVEDWTISHTFAYCNDVTDDGNWSQILLVKFPNGYVAKMPVIYKNSTIKDVIITGAENNTINIDLYQFDTTKNIDDYKPEYIYYKYFDGTAGKIKVDDWSYDTNANPAELFYRVDSTKTSYYGNVSGATYKLYATVAKNTQNEQVVEMTFNVKSRDTSSVSFGTRTNTLDVQPYEYYLYLVDNDKYSKYNPYQSKITVNYDNYSEDVYVKWGQIKSGKSYTGKKQNYSDFEWLEEGAGLSGIDYSWDIKQTKTSTAYVALDDSAYPSGDIFGWIQDVEVTVSRNQIQGVYFNKELTQTTLIINPYDYHNATSKYDYYPDTAYVKFTNGKVLELPVAWSKDEIDALSVDYSTDYTQFTLTIGFDVDKYETTGVIEGLKLKPTDTTSPFYQTYTVNVKVAGSAVKGIILEGSEYMGGAYQIDPVGVNFLGNKIFPTKVDVVYLDGSRGSLQVVKWETENANIDIQNNMILSMDQQVGINVKCYLTTDLAYDITAEVLDRSANMMTVDTSAITKEAINPYSYTVISEKKKTITYDVFESTMDVKYATSFVVTLTAAGVDEIFGTTDDIVKYSETVTSSTELSALRKKIKSTYKYVAANTYLYDGEACQLGVVSNYTDYNLPVYWDTSRMNLTSEGSTETVYFYFGYGKPYQIEKFVDVEFSAKNLDYIIDENYIYEVVVDSENKPITLSSADIEANKTKTTMKVYFTDGSYEYMDVTIDFSTARVKDSEGYYTTFGSTAFANKTRFTYTAASVGNEAGTYYVLGNYSAIRLRGNGVNYDSSETYYTFHEVENADLVANGTYYYYSNGSYVPVVINSGKTNIGTFTYFERVIESVESTTVGDFYVLNADEDDRNAYVEVDGLTDTDARFNITDGFKYYTLAISQIYEVTVTIGQINPALTQTTSIKMYVLG